MQKTWPKDNEALDYSEISPPIVELVEEILNDPSCTKDIHYEGYEQGLITGGMCVSGETLGKAQYRKHALEQSELTPIHLAVSFVFQMGMEQGKRIYIKRHSSEKNSESLLEEVSTLLAKSEPIPVELKNKIKSHLNYLKTKLD